MKKIDLAEVRNIYDYEKIRQEYRKKIIDMKKNRRVFVGNKMSFIFENRETVLFQIMEIIRAEKIVDETALKEIIMTFNDLIPNENELSATLFIEVTESRMVPQILEQLDGLDNNCIILKIGNKFSISAQFEEDTLDKKAMNTVHYIKFKFSPEQKEVFLYGNDIIFLSSTHKNYTFYAAMSDEVKSSLRIDFLS